MTSDGIPHRLAELRQIIGLRHDGCLERSRRVSALRRLFNDEYEFSHGGLPRGWLNLAKRQWFAKWPPQTYRPFPEPLARLRKDKGLTQQALADLTGISLIQIHRYENGGSQPSLEALRKLAKGLSVSADTLVFEQDERGPDERAEAPVRGRLSADPDEKQIVKALLDSLILKHQARRWAAT